MQRPRRHPRSYRQESAASRVRRAGLGKRRILVDRIVDVGEGVASPNVKKGDAQSSAHFGTSYFLEMFESTHRMLSERTRRRPANNQENRSECLQGMDARADRLIGLGEEARLGALWGTVFS